MSFQRSQYIRTQSITRDTLYTQIFLQAQRLQVVVGEEEQHISGDQKTNTSYLIEEVKGTSRETVNSRVVHYKGGVWTKVNDIDKLIVLGHTSLSQLSGKRVYIAGMSVRIYLGVVHGFRLASVVSGAASNILFLGGGSVKTTLLSDIQISAFNIYKGDTLSMRRLLGFEKASEKHIYPAYYVEKYSYRRTKWRRYKLQYIVARNGGDNMWLFY